MKNLFAEETTIKVNVITLDGRKMTKAIFNQLNYKSPFNDVFEFIGDLILGYVNDKDKWLIWKSGDSIYKYNLIPLIELCKLTHKSDMGVIKDSFNINKVLQTSDFKEEAKNESGEIFIDFFSKQQELLNEAGLGKIKDFVIAARELLDEILKHQIFL